jgi:hypothetical protein
MDDPVCMGSETTFSHKPVVMDQDWLYDNVYRCPECGAVTELWVS